MRFSCAESMTDPGYYAPPARAAEDAGFDGMVIPDSIAHPEHSDSTYPYNPDGTRELLDDKPRLEEQGVTDVIAGTYEVGPDTEPLQTNIGNLRRFAEAVKA